MAICSVARWVPIEYYYIIISSKGKQVSTCYLYSVVTGPDTSCEKFAIKSRLLDIAPLCSNCGVHYTQQTMEAMWWQAVE